MYEDILIEVARTVRECERAVERRIRERQLGEAWIGLVDEQAQYKLIEGDEELAA